MAFLQYSLGQITAWSGGPLVPTVDPYILFDNIRLPMIKAESRVEAVKSAGRAFHGLRIREVDSQIITAQATLFVETLAYGYGIRDTLRSWKPAVGVEGLGVWAVYASVGAGPYDLLAADLARPFSYVLNPVGTNIPGASIRFDYAITLKERVTPTEATP
jgi:hypothetical protein